MNAVRTPIMIVWLAIVWVLLWGDLTIQNAAAGLGIAVVVVVLARPTGTRFVSETTLRPLAAIRYIVFFLYQLVKSSLIVAREVVTPRSNLNRAIVAVPMHTTSAGINTLVGNTVTLTPGTITVDVRARPEAANGDPEMGDAALQPPTLYVHALHFSDVESMRRDVLRFEQLAVAAFGTNEQRAAVDAAALELVADRRDGPDSGSEEAAP